MATKFVAFVFALRKDNHGNRRLFRYLSCFAKQDKGLSYLRSKKNSGKYLYGVLADSSTWDAVEEFGDPQVEDNWLDTGTSTDRFYGPHMG